MTRNKRSICAAIIVAAAFSATAPMAADSTLSVKIEGLDRSGRFADSAAFCRPGIGAKDVSPGVSWSEGPEGTRSYALLLTDPDVPQDFNLINKPSTTIPADAPRIGVFHWILTDIPAGITSIGEGAESEGLVLGGKPIGMTPHGLRGANVYTSFLAKTDGMAGTYGGYDGPCPPMNDQRVHHYTLEVVALDVATLGLSGPFTGEDVEKATAGHILSSGEAIATYSLNPSLIPTVTAK
ncbi:YbhB/YbcL family Raf kinase inhibitor-like protein [Agrobacterium tumefaciens]|uniref:YbhB/YbcL family Raf kinase inhibitor-like protein n=1 Tax=Agrobacterium tumefaciens TaxID=358 RepID=UPI0012B728DB|nr:YbhB/YbcL family Raf kinase inhibitor-like protein [Agrobacterium tumefaciens]MQB04620.1 YbhB/YbcL family Raf kinase inhibitor-like protein [Agrobacterium tumefaciens]